jgi:FAD/FMN-containing dehydrogenase
VEAGCVLQNVQEAAEAAGLLFPLSLAAEGSCTIGGNLGTNAGGTQVLRYGNARELCLGLEVVTAQGEVWHGLSGLRKDNTGYDLRDLFIGSEGTLGIITAATMKLYPLPVATTAALAALPSLEDCRGPAGPGAPAPGRRPDRLRGDGPVCAELVARHFPALPCPLPTQPCTVLLEHSDTEGEPMRASASRRLLGAALEAGCVDRRRGGRRSLAQARALWHLRESSRWRRPRKG